MGVRQMEVGLITEGTYPYGFGGVSVWCDQLVRGLSQYEFHLVALVGTGSESLVWEIPGNVTTVTPIPLWGPVPPSRVGRRALRQFAPALQLLFDSLLDPDDHAQVWFAQALRALYEHARQEDLAVVMNDELAVRMVLERWQRDPRIAATKPTVGDAVTAMRLLMASLRPLSVPPPHVRIVHCVANGLATLVALAAQWEHGARLLLTEHGIYLRERYLALRTGPYRWPVKSLLLAFTRRLCMLACSSAVLVTPGNRYNQRWEERLGANPRRIRTIYNGVDPQAFPPAAEEPAVPTLSWAGRIDPIKDLETLIRAFALVRYRLPATRLRIFGGTPKGNEGYLERCRNLVTELGLTESVTFEGRVEKIRDAYAAGNVVVLSSISEGFPYTLIEAMTCGRATVATDVGGVSEAVGDTGFVVPPRDPTAMAEACLRLLRDPVLRTRLGRAARTRALGQFTVDKAVSSFDEMYRALGSDMPLPLQPSPARWWELPTRPVISA
ncbi:lipopolysaccharide glycosyltransferase, putative [Longimycelium tulufanense]|uniref:Lipopolysaccharide glycosyltransferase, putative n=1 Tax=Longimycelium tulufanense TaxID=907463 RepID=A0A8J3C8T3_9PSEU|nr:GT4 family glycosyltransferase PelF [Longimycelium tulufanense]GGM56191.1 lipopolysaccharide glycosyltransferase, putative [Longimycelium tulufanense]